MNLNSTSLHTLSLTGCLGLTNLQLACPSLQKVCLDGCDHLERASFSPLSVFFVFPTLYQYDSLYALLDSVNKKLITLRNNLSLSLFYFGRSIIHFCYQAHLF